QRDPGPGASAGPPRPVRRRRRRAGGRGRPPGFAGRQAGRLGPVSRQPRLCGPRRPGWQPLLRGGSQPRLAGRLAEGRPEAAGGEGQLVLSSVAWAAVITPFRTTYDAL